MQTTLLIFFTEHHKYFQYIYSQVYILRSFELFNYFISMYFVIKVEKSAKIDLWYFSPIIFVWLQNFDTTKIL